MIGKLCDVCGKHEAVQIACSAYGATSYAFCTKCLSNGLELYGAVVSYIAAPGIFQGTSAGNTLKMCAGCFRSGTKQRKNSSGMLKR